MMEAAAAAEDALKPQRLLEQKNRSSMAAAQLIEKVCDNPEVYKRDVIDKETIPIPTGFYKFISEDDGSVVYRHKDGGEFTSISDVLAFSESLGKWPTQYL